MLLQGPDEEDVDPDPVDPDAVEAHALSSVNLGGLSSNGSQFYSLETSSLQEERLKFYNTYSSVRSISNSFCTQSTISGIFFSPFPAFPAGQGD